MIGQWSAQPQGLNECLSVCFMAFSFGHLGKKLFGQFYFSGIDKVLSSILALRKVVILVQFQFSVMCQVHQSSASISLLTLWKTIQSLPDVFYSDFVVYLQVDVTQ